MDIATVEDIIRELVAYADSVGRSAVDLVQLIGSDDADAQIASEVIQEMTGAPVTDSVLEDLLGVMASDAGDMANE